ncbi:Methyltransferase prhM [Cladobotryum mycophilum]|uniref:Methyltransferase prhM n=1 Tax=Cladobotryum mycophilum TaxID=491253 RepID=A0ABR0SY71_9HYPO
MTPAQIDAPEDTHRAGDDTEASNTVREGDSIDALIFSEWASTVYQQKLPEDISSFRHLLETWARIPPGEIDDHLYKIRDNALFVQKYPCICDWAFTNLSKTLTEDFQAAIKRLQAPNSGDALLDLGCCLGQIVRQLAYQGIPTEKLYGADLFQEFLDIGFELFRDEGKWPADHFTAIDLLSKDEGVKEKLQGKVTIIHAAKLFHLFDWADQVSIAVRVLDFLKPDVPNPMIFGNQVGKRDNPGTTPIAGINLFLHNPGTLQRMWDEVGEATGTRWRVEAAFLDKKAEELPGLSEDCWYLGWAVYRDVEEEGNAKDA